MINMGPMGYLYNKKVANSKINCNFAVVISQRQYTNSLLSLILIDMIQLLRSFLLGDVSARWAGWASAAGGGRCVRVLLLVTMMVAPCMTEGQTLGEYVYSTGVDTTKWIDMDAATQILTPVGNDGLASSLQNIGFEFPFGEEDYSQFSVNTDGNLRLGATVTGTVGYSTPFFGG